MPAVAGDLGVDIPTAGLLVTAYALGVAVASPLLALFTGAIPRRVLLLATVAIFVIGNILCALAGIFATLVVLLLIMRGARRVGARQMPAPVGKVRVA